MKTQITRPTTGAVALSTVWAIVLSLLMMATSPAQGAGRNPNPGVLPPHANAYGYSYGDWGGLWYRWALSIPFEQNPVADTTGEFAAVGQSGPVWFLAGTFGGSVTRTVTVPSGKALFFPVLNNVWVTTCVGEFRTIAEIRQNYLLPFQADELACEIDGVPVNNLEQYLVESRLFCTGLDALGIFTQDDLAQTCPGGTSNPNCLDLPNPEEHYGPDDGFGPGMTIGYYLMLAPPKRGQHTIHLKGVNGDFMTEVTYHLTIE